MKKRKGKSAELFSFGEERVRRRLNDLRSHMTELEIAWHANPGELEPLARAILEWLANWALYRGDGDVLPEGPPGYGVNDRAGGFTATLLAKFGEIFRLTQELDRLMPDVLPSGTFEVHRLYRRVHKLLDGEPPDRTLVADNRHPRRAKNGRSQGLRVSERGAPEEADRAR